MHDKATICIIINSIGLGGAERALANILSHGSRARERFEIHLITLDDHVDCRTMPDYLTRHRLDSGGSMIRSFVLLFRLLARIKPDLAVGFLVRANVATAAAGYLLGIPTILCERMHLGSHLRGRYSGFKLFAARLLPRLAFRLATKVLGVSTGVTENLIEEFGVPGQKTATIYNPCDEDAIRAASLCPPVVALPREYIISVGRLTAAKNFDQLIEGYLLSALPHSLVILGEGEKRRALEHQVRRAGAAERILLPGYVDNPFPALAGAAFYVSASLNEGFPNALIEAMALGVPVVSSDCLSGPGEILGGSTDSVSGPVQAPFGILFPPSSLEGLVQSMRLMADPEMRASYALASRRRVQDFEAAAIAEDYWRTFDAVRRSRS